MSVEANSLPAPQRNAISRTESRNRFFQFLAGALLLIVLVGFARTLFLRPLFHVPAIPWYLYLHGAVLASWFVLLLLQTSLIAAGRARLHRRLGVLGAILAVAVVALGSAAVLGFPAHVKAGRLSIDAPIDASSVAGIVCTDFAGLTVFSTFVATALLSRHRAAIHKRLLLLGSMAIIFPAAARVAGVLTAVLLSIASVPVRDLIVFNTSVQALFVFGLPLTIAVHDVHTGRRLQPVTAWALIVYYVAMVGAIAVASSVVGRTIVQALE